MTICLYAQSACERAFTADAARREQIILYPSEKKCAGFTIAGEWGAVLFASVEDCRKAVRSTEDLDIDRVAGYYGSKMIVGRKSKAHTRR